MKDVTHTLEVIDTPIELDKENLEIINFDGVLNNVQQSLETLNTTLLQSDDDYKWAKEQRTQLRKHIKLLDRVRIDEENKVKKQIETFSKQMKQLAKEYKDTDSAVSQKLDDYDAELWTIKQAMIVELIEEHGNGYPIEIEDSWSLKKWTKNKLVEEIGRIARELGEQEQRDHEAIKSIESLADNLEIESAGWVQQYKDGKPLTDLLNDLTVYSQRKKEQEAKQSEIAQQVIEDKPVNDFLSFLQAKQDDTVDQMYQFKGTYEQQKQLEYFANNLGINLTRV